MNVPIIYFSASGNTKYIAQLIRNGLKYGKIDSELYPISTSKIDNLDFEDTEVFGLGGPIYGMNFTPNIVEWIENIYFGRETKLFFLFDTSAGIPGPAIKNLRKKIEKKNSKFIGALEIISPTRDSVFDMGAFNKITYPRKNIDRAFQFGMRIAKIIKKGDGILKWDLKPLPFSPLIAATFKLMERPFYKYASHLFTHNGEKCIECKLCEKLCPGKAIEYNKKPIIDRSKCFLCFSCTRNCPTKAFFIRLLPDAVYFKGPRTLKGYIHPDDVLKEYKKKGFKSE